MTVDLQRVQDPAAIIVTMVAKEAGNETVTKTGARTEGTRGDERNLRHPSGGHSGRGCG